MLPSGHLDPILNAYLFYNGPKLSSLVLSHFDQEMHICSCVTCNEGMRRCRLRAERRSSEADLCGHVEAGSFFYFLCLQNHLHIDEHVLQLVRCSVERLLCNCGGFHKLLHGNGDRFGVFGKCFKEKLSISDLLTNLRDSANGDSGPVCLHLVSSSISASALVSISCDFVNFWQWPATVFFMAVASTLSRLKHGRLLVFFLGAAFANALAPVSADLPREFV